MHTFQIQPHTLNTCYALPHFFIQAHGYNAGRPSAMAYKNSFVILANDEVEKGMLFWICYGLWKTNGFSSVKERTSPARINPLLAANLINHYCRKLAAHPEVFLHHVKELRELIQTEQRLSSQIKMIKLTKKVLTKQMVG